MLVYNYSSAVKRERRKYALYDKGISETGISFRTLKITSILFLPTFAIGYLVCLILGKQWYNLLLLLSLDFGVIEFWIVCIAIPFGLAMLLTVVKVSNYTLLDYIKLVIEPKPPINLQGENVRDYDVKIDTPVYYT